MKLEIPGTIEEWNARGAGGLPGHLGFEFIRVEADEVHARFEIQPAHMSWNGFMHAGSVVSLADTCCGYGTVKSLPEGANGFTTINLTSNFVGTALSGAVICTAKPAHQGRSTQLWNAIVTAEDSGKTMANFTCTQLILWPR